MAIMEMGASPFATVCRLVDSLWFSLRCYLFLGGAGRILHGVVFVSAVQRCESGTCVHISPPSWASFPPRTPIPPPRSSRSTELSSPAIHQLPASFLFHTWWCIHINPNLPVHLTPASPAQVHTSDLYIFVSIPALKIGSSVPFFPGFCIYVLINDICLTFSDLFHCMTDSWPIHISTNDPVSSLFIGEEYSIFQCIYVLYLVYPFICWWTFRLLPCPGYRKQCCSERWSLFTVCSWDYW